VGRLSRSALPHYSRSSWQFGDCFEVGAHGERNGTEIAGSVVVQNQAAVSRLNWLALRIQPRRQRLQRPRHGEHRARAACKRIASGIAGGLIVVSAWNVDAALTPPSPQMGELSTRSGLE